MHSDSIRVIVGLGNPGAEYLATRHNLGFWFLDALASEFHAAFRSNRRLHGDVARIKFEGDERLLLKPGTFVNESGRAVRAALDYFKYGVTELLVVHDDLDLPPGSVRVKRGGGHGGHNGLRDIIRHVGADFARLRFGIGHPPRGAAVIDYVLSAPRGEQEALILDAFGAARTELSHLVGGDFNVVARVLHTRETVSR